MTDNASEFAHRLLHAVTILPVTACVVPIPTHYRGVTIQYNTVCWNRQQTCMPAIHQSVVGNKPRSKFFFFSYACHEP